MAKEMLINVSEGEECRIALLEDGRLEELYMERTSATSHVGNIYKGRVTNVEPSIQAAFIDFGLGRNGFLHISDLMPTYFGKRGDFVETVGRKMARRDRPPIQRCLRRGDDIVVQIIKEGIGTKGPTLTTYLSIPGRILVMMPGMANKGVSKKIEDDQERRRLRQILDGLEPPEDCGFIIRTAGIGKSKLEIERDLKYLARLWETLKKKRDTGPAPEELYTEGDLVTRTVRDVFTSDIDRIVIDSKDVAKRVKEVIKITAPRTRNKVEVYDDMVPLFHTAGIEREIEMMYSRHVPLPSGGSLVIDTTEAVVAIDVNSGKSREHSDAETTAFRTDMEAADEIPRQLKLRDLGGVIICDFIDLRYERHRRELEERLHENFKRDRAKTKVLRMSQFGIIEITRQRMRPSLKRSIYFDCPHCRGAGLVKTPESMSLDVMRRLAIAANDTAVVRIDLAVCPEIAFYLLNRKRTALSILENESKKRVNVRQDTTIALDEMKLRLYDLRDNLVFLKELGMDPSDETEDTSRRPGGRQQGRHERGRQGRHLPFPALPARRESEADGLFEDQDDVDDSQTDRPDAPAGVEEQEGAEGAENAEMENDPEGEEGQESDGPRPDDRAANNDRGRNNYRGANNDRGRNNDRGGNNNRGRNNDRARENDRPRENDRSRNNDRGRDISRPAQQGDRSNQQQLPNRNPQGNQGNNDRGYSQNEGGNSGQSEGTGQRRRRRRRGRGRGNNDRFEQVQPFSSNDNRNRQDSGPMENVVESDVDYGDESLPQNEQPAPQNRGRGRNPNDRNSNYRNANDRNANDRTNNDRNAPDRSADGQNPIDRNVGDRNVPNRNAPESNVGDQNIDDREPRLPEDPFAHPDDPNGNIASEEIGEAGNEPGSPVAGDDSDAPRRRRRRRGGRGRRGRGRSGQQDGTADGGPLPEGEQENGPTDEPVSSDTSDAPVQPATRDTADDLGSADEVPADINTEIAPIPQVKPRAASRSRGRRGGGRRAAGASDTTRKADKAGVQTPDGAEIPAASESSRSTPIPQPPVVKTGSVDKHLADDEPIDEAPVQRPRSRRDLDALPEDYD